MVLDRLKSFLPDLIFWITTVIYRNYKNQDINYVIAINPFPFVFSTDQGRNGIGEKYYRIKQAVNCYLRKKNTKTDCSSLGR